MLFIKYGKINSTKPTVDMPQACPGAPGGASPNTVGVASVLRFQAGERFSLCEAGLQGREEGSGGAPGRE